MCKLFFQLVFSPVGFKRNRSLLEIVFVPAGVVSKWTKQGKGRVGAGETKGLGNSECRARKQAPGALTFWAGAG